MNSTHLELMVVGLAVLAGLGTLVRALGTAVVIVGMQWAVLSLTSDPRAWGVALGVPALFAGAAIARMFSVTELVHNPTHQGARR